LVMAFSDGQNGEAPSDTQAEIENFRLFSGEK